MFKREDLKDLLASNKAVVTFKKTNGELRVMSCTLQSDFLPPLKGSNHKRSEEVLPVWDLEKEDWRSFRLDSVQEVKVL